jgi:renalase
MSIAIVGAGVAGLVAAWSIRDGVTVFEKSGNLTGRAATGRYDREGGRVYVDHGAQYIKTDGPALSHLVLSELPRDELSDIARPVWTFDAGNVIAEGDPIQNAAPKWSYRHGLSFLGRLIAGAAGLTIRTQQGIAAIKMDKAGAFELVDTEGQSTGRFDHVIVAIPAGEAADLIARSQISRGEQLALEQALRTAAYRRCLSVVLGFDRPLMPRPYYALVNTDRAHPISWVGAEHDKPGHVPVGHAALVVQMAGAYSLARWDDEAEVVVRDVAARTSALLGEDLTAPAWTDVQRWRYALPDALADPSTLNGIVKGLWFAGDYLAGGRVHLAAESGYQAARQSGARR